MERRSNAVSGLVNFPVDSNEWKNTEEGGMMVKLVVCDNSGKYQKCHGSVVTDILSGAFISDDRCQIPRWKNEQIAINPKAKELNVLDWEKYHFPAINLELVGVEKFMSRDYLAVIVLGSTGWSGLHQEDECYWGCRFQDLTVEGQMLYRQIETIYPECDIHLLTFLDT